MTASTATLRAVVFDMDGLLADTEPLSYRAWTALLAREYGVTMTLDDEEWSAQAVGKSSADVWAMIGERFGLPFTLPDDLPKLDAAYKVLYHEVLAQGVAPMPGAIDLVRACRDAGLRIGVASSSTMTDIRLVLASIGLHDHFASLTSGKEVPRSKPDPAIYRLACERLGVAPAEAVALEDSGPGVLAARRAGLRCLAVPSDYTASHDFTPATAIRHSLVGVQPADLAALLG